MNGGFRLGDIGVIGALIVNIIIGTWQIAHLDGRIGSVEREQLRDENNIDSLNKADVDKAEHLIKVDNAVENMKNNIDTILQAVQRIENNTSSGDANNQPNFTHHK